MGRRLSNPFREKLRVLWEEPVRIVALMTLIAMPVIILILAISLGLHLMGWVRQACP